MCNFHSRIEERDRRSFRLEIQLIPAVIISELPEYGQSMYSIRTLFPGFPAFGAFHQEEERLACSVQ